VERIVRYQAAVIQDGFILLVKQRGENGYQWWNVPGGGLEAGETEEQCVIREVKEETNLDVRIDHLLIDGPSHRHSPYQRFKTYLCVPVKGAARADHSESFEVKWFDLSDESQWRLDVVNNETTYVMLQRIRAALSR
jgi:ADP-ribose pyrophosphatase YjhB (NUDIX family)